jgi:carboxypeptidase family protein
MKRCPTPRLLAVIIAAISILLFAVSGFAQFQTGNIYGKVQAKDGSVLPGVTVTLTGIGAPQTAYTDTAGNFRFINLSPGTYSIKAELAGYGAVTRTGIGVRVAQNADVTLTLNPSVAESITVTAEAPLLDVRKAGTGIDVSKVELQNIPTGRDPWVIMQQTPGVLMDRINVGGSESGQQSNYVSKGTDSSQSTWNVDGVNITDVGALGSTPTYYDFDSFEEMQITTGGSDPRIMTPGIQMNFVTKRGTNDFKGSGRWFQTNSSWQASPKIPAEATPYLSRVNQINRIEDRGLEFGGPILKDRLWLWGAFSRNNINLLTSTLTTTGVRAFDKTLLMNENLKLNAQLLSSNSFVLTDSYGDKVKKGRNVSPTRPPETAYNQRDVYRGGGNGSLSNPTVWKAEDTQIFGSSLYLTGMYSEVQGGFELVGDAGQGCDSVACTTSGPVAWNDPSGVWHRNFVAYQSIRPQSQARLDGSKFFDIGTMNHELKFGLGYRHAPVTSISAWAGNQLVFMFDNTNGGVSLTRSPETNFTYKVAYQDAYIGDTILLGNLTVQAAARYDKQTGNVLPGSLGANPIVPEFLPAISWGNIKGPSWNNISPRVGLTYALGAQKRTLLRASYNRYAGQLGGSDIYLMAPGNYNYEYFYFTDLNGDKQAQRNEIDFGSGPQYGNGVDPNNPNAIQQYYRIANGFKAPTTDEFIAGFETELLTDFSVGVNGTWRNLKNFSWTVGEHHQGQGDLYSPADFVLHSTPATCTGNSAAFGSCSPFPAGVSVPYYVLKPGVPTPTFFVIENRPDYHQTYKSLDLFATKRLSNRWMARAGFTLQDWKQHVGPNAIINPTNERGTWGCTNCNNSDVVIGSGTGSGAKGGVYINSKWAYNLTATYQIPVIETNLGINLNGRQGYAVPYVVRVNGNNGTSGGGHLFVLAENSPTAFRLANPIELDLRLAKDIRVGPVGLTLSVDGFNMLDRRTILQRNVTRLNLSSSNEITELQAPRVFRLGARFNF